MEGGGGMSNVGYGNGNVALSILRKLHVTLSILSKPHVACR